VVANSKVNKKIILREEGDEAFLFNPETGTIKTLNLTGISIWKLCDGSHSKEEIIDRVTKEYDVKSKDIAKKDLDDFLQMLEKADFISNA